jgi:hypothetical protein
MKMNGFDLNKPISTIEGDEVLVLAVQNDHPFPVVGEVHDYNSNVGWLARWNLAGQYRGTDTAAAKHSLLRNDGTLAHVAQAVPVKKVDLGRPASLSSAPVTNLGQLLRDKLARDKAAPVADPEFDAGFAEAIAEGNARTKSQSIKDQLGKVYLSALAGHSLMEVAAVAFHINNLIERGRLRFPQGIGTCDYTDLAGAMRFLVTHPTATMEWIDQGATYIGLDLGIGA